MKYALVCVNEDARVVSVELFDDKEKAINEMNSQVRREFDDAEESGMCPSIESDGDCYKYLSYGGVGYSWEIKPAYF